MPLLSGTLVAMYFMITSHHWNPLIEIIHDTSSVDGDIYKKKLLMVSLNILTSYCSSIGFFFII